MFLFFFVVFQGVGSNLMRFRPVASAMRQYSSGTKEVIHSTLRVFCCIESVLRADTLEIVSS